LRASAHLSVRWPDAMRGVVVAVVAALRSITRSRLELAAEILALRHQLTVLRQRAPKRLGLGRTDRLVWILLSRFWSGWREALQIVSPDTVGAWHRQGFALYWRWRSRPRGIGRPPVSRETRELIQRMQRANPLWGAPRIHAELLKLGIQVSQATVAKYARRPTRPPSQHGRTFLANQTSQLASMDFFTVPTATFRVLFVLVILSHDRRRIVHVNVTAHPTTGWTAQQLREAWEDRVPRFLIRDRDAIYGWMVRRTLHGMGIQEVVTAPHAPWQNPFVERVIGSIRRECLDHVVVWNERGLCRQLRRYVAYYNQWRPVPTKNSVLVVSVEVHAARG
jgi:putative transposase